MANIHNDLNSLFSAVADSIRTKKESTEGIIADNFPDEIRNLKTKFDYVNPMVTHIADSQFKNCESLRNVDCPNLVSIGASAFEGCSGMKEITIPESAVSVGENAFNECNCIIYCKADSISETWDENWNPDNCLVLYGEPVETWDISAIEKDSVIAELYSAGIDNRYTLYIYGNGDMSDYDYGMTPWYNNYIFNILNIIISDGVTNIGERAFQNCLYLKSITIPDGVTSIGKSAFYGCAGLTSITIPNSVTSIGYSVFRGCRAKTAGLIGGGYDYEFGWTDKIPKNAFQGCDNLTSVVIPDGVTSIGDSAFEDCASLISITIPNSVTRIGQVAFSGCKSLTSITIPNNITNIYAYTFKNCESLTSIIIPNNVTSISYDAFSNCTSLTSITIPNSVTSISNRVFYRCTSLTSITYKGTVAQWNAITFGENWNDDTGDYTIHCTDGDIAKDGTITHHKSNTREGDA